MAHKISKVDSIFSEHNRRKKLKEELKIEKKNWHKDDVVIYKTKEQTFKAEIVGFNENSAIVYNLKENRVYNVSFRNMYDPASLKPLKNTKRFEAVSVTNRWLTAYNPTDKERTDWLWE